MIVQTAPVRVGRPRPSPVYRKKVTRGDMVETTGKFLGLFVLFTSTANWWFYRRVREEKEKNTKK
jgi:hypothetical protein